MLLRTLGRATSVTAGVSIGATVAAFALSAAGVDHIVVFVVSAVALAALATLIAVAEWGGVSSYRNSLFNLRYGLAAAALDG
jgi:hypothetical protein